METIVNALIERTFWDANGKHACRGMFGYETQIGDATRRCDGFAGASHSGMTKHRTVFDHRYRKRIQLGAHTGGEAARSSEKMPENEPSDQVILQRRPRKPAASSHSVDGIRAMMTHGRSAGLILSGGRIVGRWVCPGGRT